MTYAADGFERASLGTNWTKSTSLSTLAITSSSDLGPSGGSGTDNAAWYNGSPFGSNHYSEVVLSANGGGAGDNDGGGPLVRHQSAASTFYTWFVDSVTFAAVFEVTTGSFAQLGASYTWPGATVGDSYRLDATGSTLTPSYKGSALATRSDASIANGAPGVHIYEGPTSPSRLYESWLGGPVSAAAALGAIMPPLNPASRPQ